jgi:hypothetical protein
MKKSLLLISGIITIMSLLLCGCVANVTDYATVIDDNFTKTLAVVTATRTTISSEAVVVDEEALLAKVKGTTEGVIDIDGAGRFYYEKFTDGVVLQGVTFIDYYAYKVADGTTFTGPINYWVEFNFADSSKKYLSNVGLLFDDGVEINFVQGDDGTIAGVMMLKYHEDGSMMRIVYVLVAIPD